ncbi:MAG TPA: methyltransferase domain-containing protein [Paracoccus sp. (in: a-proteobacteria)]|uniref:class I SAM-dependent methyltransferase n=1 Tax=uncultured Paracoccus sp. TaxID=189685 RepID=UPI00262028DE|nr:class I SAM-dependent methyltransferase [uncultured Paracoccus sp.]HMQ41103.1 methyltransferase domain-containing protein [Paracoccus sp. (in: a-proteobacteria)]HMR36094.1 methyltransferase domain-containing protein [Paracoccus sp. (in: a-proteobacteria)]
MLVSSEDCLTILRCPLSGEALVRDGSDRLRTASGRVYPVLRGKPVLVDFSDSVLSEEAVMATKAHSQIARKNYNGLTARIKRLVSPEKKATARNVARLIADLEALGRPARLLVIGGGSVGQGMAPIYDHPGIEIYAFDIYDTPNVQFIADGHHLPLPDDLFDAVIIQAVLEHVLQPAQVVAEIWRVLRPGGLVYAETPFMQQVHEGPYDFTRFTESGHRYLFRNFDVLASGASGGPGVQFMWSVDYLARSVFRSRKAGKAAKLAFFWTQYLDRIIPPDYAQDAASGVFFYGRKADTPISPRDIVAYYQGAQ